MQKKISFVSGRAARCRVYLRLCAPVEPESSRVLVTIQESRGRVGQPVPNPKYSI